MPIDMPATPADSGDEVQQAQAQAQAQAQQDAHEVRISKGRIVRLREATIEDEEEALRLLAQLGHDPSQLALATIMRTNALLCIESINGAEHRAPRTADELKTFRLLFTPADGMKLGMAYIRVNGLDDETFRDAG